MIEKLFAYNMYCSYIVNVNILKCLSYFICISSSYSRIYNSQGRLREECNGCKASETLHFRISNDHSLRSFVFAKVQKLSSYSGPLG